MSLAWESIVDWQHSNVTCLLGRDLSEFDFLSATRDGFVPVPLKPVESNRLRQIGRTHV